MTNAFERNAVWSLLANVAMTVTIAAAINGVLAALGWNQPPHEKWPDFAPRGATIGVVWIVLFAAMGAARWLLMRSESPQGAARANAVAALIALCLAYPFYTHFLGSHVTELAGNIVTFAFAAWLLMRARRSSPLAAVLIGCVMGWIAFATVLVFALVRLNGWQT